MALLLVQHGKCLSKTKDPEQSLSEEGIATVKRIAGVAKGYGVGVSIIEHSVKKRARQTAGLFADALRPVDGIRERTGLKPMDDVAIVGDRIRSADNVMLVGHLPYMERLASYLVAGSWEKRIFKFQNSGIVALDQDDEDGSWYVKWALMPDID